MEQFTTYNDNFYNAKCIMDNICREYQSGMDYLKPMFAYFQDKPNLISEYELQQFQDGINCVESNLNQLNECYKNLESLCTDYTQQTDDLDTTKSVTYLNLDIHSQDRIQCEPNLQILNYELNAANYSDTVMHEDKLSSSIEYLLSLSDSDDLLDFIKCESSINSNESVGNTEDAQECKQDNPNTACLLYSAIKEDSESKSKSRKPNTKVSRSKTTKCTNKCDLGKKNRPNEARIWYKCAWEGCSFGSFYNGVVKRHSFKRHSGKMKIDKSSNSSMHRFKCDWPGCEVSLVAYHKLVEHKRKHTGEKPFRCKWKSCNYATARLYSMIIHERTHKLDPFTE